MKKDPVWICGSHSIDYEHYDPLCSNTVQSGISPSIGGELCLHLQSGRVNQPRTQQGSRQRTDPLCVLHVSCWLIASLNVLPWRWRWYVPPKRHRTSTKVHGVTTQDTLQDAEKLPDINPWRLESWHSIIHNSRRRVHLQQLCSSY
jgi:hypothetical protein